MDAFERCFKIIDEINDDLREIRRYRRNTNRMIIVLWGIGWPLTTLGSLLYMARH